MTTPLVILLTRDPRLAEALPPLLPDGFAFQACGAAPEAFEAAAAQTPAALAADLTESSGGGHAEDRLLESWQQRFPDVPVVLLTADECPEPLERRAACSGMRHLRGEVEPQRLAALLTEILAGPAAPQTGTDSETTASAHAHSDAEEELPDALPRKDDRRTVLQGLTRQFETHTPRLARMLADLEVAARHTVTILLIGETGSGKTFLSRLIHEVSPRREEPFLTVACGALPAELIESELFGHVKGAFTSAHADKEGKFVAAARGTVLLDEIDVLSPEQQVKLLRVIETGEFEPVGSNRTLKSQARLVVASNLDLQPLVEQGRFRPDLYYRLNMLKFEVLPLRERRPDIIPLARKFVRQLSEKHGIEIREIDPDLFDALFAYPWPGNVRELENVIQRAVIYCRDGRLEAGHLPPHILAGVAGPVNDPSVQLGPAPGDPGKLGRKMALTEREIIEQALFKNNFSRTNTARELGISRVTLYNKMKKYGMSRQDGA